jgi:hypothetical protein
MSTNEFDPTLEAAKDTIYIHLANEAARSLNEYHDILRHANTTWRYGDCDMQYLSGLVNDALRITIKAQNAAYYRYNQIYITLGGD